MFDSTEQKFLTRLRFGVPSGRVSGGHVPFKSELRCLRYQWFTQQLHRLLMKSHRMAAPLPNSILMYMDVRVIIISHADDSCQVSVLAPTSKRIWTKKYRYKRFCLDELISNGLLTHEEKAEAQVSGLDNRDRTFVVQAKIEPVVLRAAEFVEQKKEYVH
jgi:hypothetical protein